MSGMTAAIYCLRSGFDVTVYEQHSRSGGLCTGWKRQGFTFEGALHWLNDSNEADPMYRLWHDTGILEDGVKTYRGDPYCVYDHQGTKINLYRDLDKLKDHLLEISPDDEKAIKMLYGDVQTLRPIRIPIMDIPGLKARYKSRLDIPALLKMAPVISKMKRLSAFSALEYAAAFKHPAMRKAIGQIIVNKEFGSFSLLHTMANFMKSGVYPEGGSFGASERMEKKINSMGGRILFNTKVDRVIIENRQARGLEIQGEKFLFDAVIVSQDLLTVDKLLHEMPGDRWVRAAKSNPPIQSTFASIGVRANLTDAPFCFIFDESINAGGIQYDTISIRNYAAHTNYAPSGCTALTSQFIGDSYDFWNDQKQRGTYGEQKQQFADELKCLLEKYMPQLSGKIEILDVATPLSYERYTGAYRGAWMTVMPKDRMSGLPSVVSSEYKKLYFIGFRTKVPGGLPIALVSGFRAAQYACRDHDMVFEGQV